jgi:hypothetical protein
MYPFISSETYLTVSHPALRLRPHLIATSVLMALTAFLTQGHQPKIRETVSNGYKIWQVYDPATQKKTIFHSEHDVQVWLENRYRQ